MFIVAPLWDNPQQPDNLYRNEPLMKVNTKMRKKAIREFEQIMGRRELIDQMYQVYRLGKQGFDALVKELGVMLVNIVDANATTLE